MLIWGLKTRAKDTQLGLATGIQQSVLILGLKTWPKDPCLYLTPSMHHLRLVLGLKTWTKETHMGLTTSVGHPRLVLGLGSWVPHARMRLALQFLVPQDGLSVCHRMTLLYGGSEGQLGMGDGQGGMGYVLQGAGWWPGDEDISTMTWQGSIAPVRLVVAMHFLIPEDLVASRLWARHVHLVGGSHHPTEKHLLQLNPQHIVAVLHQHMAALVAS